MPHNFLKNRIKSMPKFNIGQYVYGSFSSTVGTLRKTETCSICNGKANIMYNGQNIACPNCKNGTTTVIDYDVFFERHTYENKARLISEVRMNFNKDTQNVEYHVENHVCSEDKLFVTFEESKENCKKLNSILEQEERKKYGSKYDEKCVPVVDYNCQVDTSNQKEQEQTAMPLELISCQYDFGDTLYYIHNEYKEITYNISCSVCNGSEVIEVHGKHFPCPECRDKKVDKNINANMPLLESLTLNSVQIILECEPFFNENFIKNTKVIKRENGSIVKCEHYCTADNCLYISESSCVRNPLLKLHDIESACDKLVVDIKDRNQCDISKECFTNIKDIKENIRETTLNDFNIAFMNTANRDNIDYYLEVYGLTELPESLQSIGGMADEYYTDVSNLTPEIFLMDLPEVEKKRLEDIISKARKDFIKGNPSFDETSLFN